VTIFGEGHEGGPQPAFQLHDLRGQQLDLTSLPLDQREQLLRDGSDPDTPHDQHTCSG